MERAVRHRRQNVLSILPVSHHLQVEAKSEIFYAVRKARHAYCMRLGKRRGGLNDGEGVD